MQFDGLEMLGNVNYSNNDLAKESIKKILDELNKDNRNTNKETPGTIPGYTTFHIEDDEQIEDEAYSSTELKDEEQIEDETYEPTKTKKEDNKRKYTDEEIKAFKEKRNANYRYFNVPEIFLETETTKSENWVYLTHCRSVGLRTTATDEKDQKIKTSKAALNAVQRFFNDSIDQTTYDLALKSLESKGLIKVHDIKEDESTGFYKTNKKIEILKNDKDKLIPLPRELMDNTTYYNAFRNMRSKDIKLVIGLYANINSKDWNCIDKNYFSLCVRDDEQLGLKIKFGDGYNRLIFNKLGFDLFTPFKNAEKFTYNTKNLGYDEIKEITETKLFNLVPVLYALDEEDPLLKQAIGEIYNFDNNGYLIHIPDELENFQIIWLLKPVYPVRIKKKYDEFRKIEKEHYNRQYLIYRQLDESTRIQHKSRLLYDDDFIIYLFDNLELPPKTEYYKSFDDIEEYSSYINDKLEYLNELENKQDLQTELEFLEYSKKEEQKEIELMNKTISQRTGKRSRKTTSSTLKTIESRIEATKNKLEEINYIELDLISNIPHYYFKYFEEDFI